MKAYISLDQICYSEKPEDSLIGKTKHRIRKNWKRIDITEIADKVGNKGYAMIPAHLNGGIDARCCEGMQIIALDFDKNISFDEIKHVSESNGLKISFAYHTYSSTEENERFRVVFILEELVTDKFSLGVIIKMMHLIFPECDHSCVNLDRLFWGGKDLIYFNENARIHIKSILDAFYHVLDKNNNFSRNINKFCKDNHIFMINNLPVICPIDTKESFDELLDSTIIHMIEGSNKTSTDTYFIAESINKHQSVTCKMETKKLNLNKGQGCKLWDIFLNGEDIDHQAKFALFTNLKFINGGKKRFLNTLEKYDYASYEKWSKDIKYMKLYKPQRCSNMFCPFYNECETAGTIISTLDRERKIYIDKEEYYSKNEAFMQLKENLQEAFESSKKGFHLIKAQTALGKTTAYMDLVLNNNMEKFIIALPTNILKQQVKDDLLSQYYDDPERVYIPKISEEEIFVTASVHDRNSLIPKSVRTEIADTHNRGIHNKTKKILKDYLETIKDDISKYAIIKECKKLIHGVKAIVDERVIITTHAYLMNMPEEILKNYHIIIDEDILQLQFFTRTNQVSLESLEDVSKKNIPGYSDLAKEMLSAEVNRYQKITPCSELYDAISEFEGSTYGDKDNVGDLIYAGAYVKAEDERTGETVLKYFCPVMMPKLKYIVLSATLNSDMYMKYFGATMNIFDEYKEIKAAYEGKLMQYTFHSLGKRDLKKKENVFQYACRIADNPDLDIITFKDFGEKYPMDGKYCIHQLHFGNSTGINSLKGKDIGIVGTFFKIESEYKLIACYLGANVNTDDDKQPKPRRIQYKKKNFIITTYKDPLLREIQLYAIESEMEQCVGRARLLRFDCTVYLFSAFPCEQAQIHINDYLRDARFETNAA